MRRGAQLVAVALLVLVARPADANVGDYMRAARMLNEWQFEQGRTEIERLAKDRPKAKETRYLRGELAFLDGDYAGALAHIEGLADDDVFGNVGALRQLAASTLDATSGFATFETDHFIITFAPGKDEVLVELTAEVLEKARAAIGEDLGYVPPEKIRVEILGRPSDLAKVSTLTVEEIETTGTIALCKYGKLMVVSPRATLFGYSWMDTMVHEYVHYVVSRMTNDRVPVWLQEGIARFEQARWRQEPRADDLEPYEQGLLAGALKKRRLITFDEMHPSMAKLPSAEAAALAFAEVYTMVGFIHDQRGYAGVRDALLRIKRGRSARRAVAEVMGGGWNKVEGRWKRYLRSLDLSEGTRIAGRADHIRFKAEEDQPDENAGIDVVKDDKARRFTRLGNILYERRMPEAAVIEYEKALSAEPNHPYVQAKLAQTYLAIQRYDDALRVAEPLVEKDESDAAAATTVGLAHAARRRPKQAAQAFEIALRVQPFDPAVRCGLADAYERLRDDRAARERKACETLSVVR